MSTVPQNNFIHDFRDMTLDLSNNSEINNFSYLAACPRLHMAALAH